MSVHEIKDSYKTTARKYAKGIGDAVADRTINRKLENGKRETWAQVAERVAKGNSMLHPGTQEEKDIEFHKMHHHLRQASLLMSGRHLQHGDESQINRNLEVFSNCSTSASTFLSFYLLLNGSGVGRAYDDSMMIVDYSNLPIVAPVIDMNHADCRSGEITINDLRTTKHIYANKEIVEFHVEDSREGWAKAIEVMERMAFEGNHRDKVLAIDFSQVRPRGAPIMGMQGRPASGPGPLISAIKNVANLREAEMAPWRAAMYADHYVAECVLVGGARRAARMATKFWKDRTVLDFISVKRGGFLWSSNNSVTVDAEFWDGVKAVEEALTIIGTSDPILAQSMINTLLDKGVLSETEAHAHRVFTAIVEASYNDGTGEPGLINVDRLSWNPESIGMFHSGDFAESQRYKLDDATNGMFSQLAKAWEASKYKVITNPCGEIVLSALGGYCTIADVVPYHAKNDKDAEEAFRAAVRALIRTNTMDALYGKEVDRTNRIGVGITGLHEYAWDRFGFGWKDIIDEQKAKPFWEQLAKFSNACVEEAKTYSEKLGVAMPHTVSTIKPAGCASLDTLVRTSIGTLSMEDIFEKNGVSVSELGSLPAGTWIQPSTTISVFDKDNVEREITKLYVNGYKTVYEVQFEDGFKVKLTGNHKLLTLTGWKRVDELTEDDEIVDFKQSLNS